MFTATYNNATIIFDHLTQTMIHNRLESYNTVRFYIKHSNGKSLPVRLPNCWFCATTKGYHFTEVFFCLQYDIKIELID